MWWLSYLVGIALLVVVAAWAGAGVWWRRPTGPIDDVELRNRAAALEARERRKLHRWATDDELAADYMTRRDEGPEQQPNGQWR
jgi:hypothetical protein